MIINKFKILNNIQIELIEYFNTKKICRHLSCCAAYFIEGIKNTISNQPLNMLIKTEIILTI